MIEVGKVNTCRVVRRSEIGVFLELDDDWGDVLLPLKYVPEGLDEGDSLDVFIYFDSEGRIISTTLKPFAQVGDFAGLRVTAIEEIGVFLDWGLDKDLFLPFREQLFKMEIGHTYAVHIYLDSSGRPAASTRIDKFIDKKSRPPYSTGDQVELLLYQQTDLGLKAVVDGKYTGIIYRDDIINNLSLGQTLRGYIKTVRDDQKIDLSLRPIIKASASDLAELILKKINENGGYLEITSKSTAEVINEVFGVSRKKFKIALGALYKQKRIEIEENGIRVPGPF